MNTIPKLSEGQLKALAKFLGIQGTGTDISRILSVKKIVENSGESTKWRRLWHVFCRMQQEDNNANRIIEFIETFLTPVLFINRINDFNNCITQLNVILVFSGLEYTKSGKCISCNKANTLEEAERRVQLIQHKLERRHIHAQVTKYCCKELMQDNYFHAVFEAAKGLAQRIRDMTTIKLDGASLVDRVFSSESPILVLNTLQTETEKSEHKGFAALLKGCFSAIRNPLAHEPKILWEGEDDAADYLTLISLLHRKLDSCVLNNFKII